ncbi:hypothetical protein NQ854_25525 [Rhodococcus ruber]|uniref:hypothetical protein n=1 Tax=Rhodococcus ruber TaxID=1830 RepID=UPI00387DC1AE
MAIPRWDDPSSKHGTMVRGALWLVQEVGEGNTFTKDELRKAFPGVAQVDRRIRDLRAYGWKILTSTQDASLTAEDQRFVSAGVPVWDKAARAAAARKAIPAKDRQTVLERDGFQCTTCGIAGGEAFADAPGQVAVLSVTKRSTLTLAGDSEDMLVTVCSRCASGGSGEVSSVDEVIAEYRDLDPVDQARFRRWVARGRRGQTPLERAWTAYRRLPADARIEVYTAVAPDENRPA